MGRVAHPVYQTKLWRGDSTEDVLAAAAALLAGHPVAFPTETVYGLGTLASSSTAAALVFSAKQRPADNPLIVHLPSPTHRTLAPPPGSLTSKLLGSALVPGPLTVVTHISSLAEGTRIAPEVSAGLDTVGLRVPQHPVALALLAAVDEPVAAPSANRSGRPSPTRAEHVVADLWGRIAGVLADPDETSNAGGLGLESTVVDVSRPSGPVILRPGAVGADNISRVLGVDVESHSSASSVATEQEFAQSKVPRAPGMKYRHYAPSARMILVNSKVELENRFQSARQAGLKIGVLISTNGLANDQQSFKYSTADIFVDIGADEIQASKNLYGGLREFDDTSTDGSDTRKSRVDVIMVHVEVARDSVVGIAFWNRMDKALAAD